MKPAALLAVLLPLVLGSRTPLSFSNHPTDSDRQRITDVPSNYPFSAVLAADQVTGDPIYQLNWVFDSTQDTITFNVIVKNTGWFGLGLSPDGGMSNSDVVIGWIAADGTVYFHDRYADAEAPPPIDAHQDWFLLAANEAGEYQNFTFTRKWITCDNRDRDVQADTARVVFSWNPVDPPSVNLTFDQYHGPYNRGSTSLNLLGGSLNPTPIPADSKTFIIAASNVLIPAQPTTYWCTGYKLPADLIPQTQYILQYAPLIALSSKPYVHHMLLYHCPHLNESTDLGHGYDCNYAPSTMGSCRMGNPLVAAWAVGGTNFTYPKGVALPLGGPTDYPYLVLETHYNNPSSVSGIIDSSGYEFTYTADPPVHEAGILTVGYPVSPFMIIPPNVPSFNVTGTCISDCTNSYFPPTGINIFANILHTHLAGRGLTLRHLRQNASCGVGYQELPFIDQNLNYDFNFQQADFLHNEVVVLPVCDHCCGDVIQLSCYYNTIGRSNVTLGADATTDEMCLSFLMYYPRIDAGSCFGEADIKDYFPFTQKYLSPADFNTFIQLLNSTDYFQLYNGLKQIFDTLTWDQEQVTEFQSIFTDQVIDGFCTLGNGSYIYEQGLQPPNIHCPYNPPYPCP